MELVYVLALEKEKVVVTTPLNSWKVLLFASHFSQVRLDVLRTQQHDTWQRVVLPFLEQPVLKCSELFWHFEWQIVDVLDQFVKRLIF